VPPHHARKVQLSNVYISGETTAPPAISGAIDQFLADAKARDLRDSSIRKYRRLLVGEFFPFCCSRNIGALNRLTTDVLREFRESLNHAAVTQQKKLECLRAFLTFCQQSDWISSNPSKGIKFPRVRRKQVRPFTAGELQSLLDACDEYRGDGQRLRAMILLLRATGLRIADAVALSRDRVKNRRLFLYTSKTGVPVWCPLPEDVVEALDGLSGETHFFWSGNGELKSAIEDWRRRLIGVAALAKVDNAHFHRFRHTFSTSLLEKGVPVEMVATLLGNTPAVVMKHYAAFVESRQRAIEVAVRNAWV